jgi:glutathione S-transferase
MLVLCGSALSNYYNKVKLTLLEKGVPFTEELVLPFSGDDALNAASPLQKIPFLRTERGSLCESQAIAEYLDAAYPNPPLLPADPFAAAKVRELITFTELHVELTARELYRKAFFGGTLSDDAAADVKLQLVKHIAAFKQLAAFAPYAAGDQFTLADCSAWGCLPLVSLATKMIYREDLIASAGIDWKRYDALISARPAAQKVVADRKAAQLAAAKK